MANNQANMNTIIVNRWSQSAGLVVLVRAFNKSEKCFTDTNSTFLCVSLPVDFVDCD